MNQVLLILQRLSFLFQGKLNGWQHLRSNIESGVHIQVELTHLDHILLIIELNLQRKVKPEFFLSLRIQIWCNMDQLGIVQMLMDFCIHLFSWCLLGHQLHQGHMKNQNQLHDNRELFQLGHQVPTMVF